eukprot:2628737-Rhodomonas_salina.3
MALNAWAAAPRGGMISILVAIGLIEMISNSCRQAGEQTDRQREMQTGTVSLTEQRRVASSHPTAVKPPQHCHRQPFRILTAN